MFIPPYLPTKRRRERARDSSESELVHVAVFFSLSLFYTFI